MTSHTRAGRATHVASVARASTAAGRPDVLFNAGLILLAAMVVYANSFGGVLVFDDESSIVNNPQIRTLVPLDAAMAAPADTTLAGRPIAALTLALNYALAPADARESFRVAGQPPEALALFRRNVWGYHAVNLAIHVLAGLALFGLVRRILLLAPLFTDAERRAAMPLAAAVAAVWVVHPLQTSAVTYLVQRVESLMGLFYLLTMYAAVRAVQDTPGRRWWIAAAVAACALGMATKETTISAPIMVLLLDLILWRRPFREAWRERWPLYAGLAATWFILAAILLTTPRSGSVGFGLGISAWAYLATQAGVLAHYLRLVVVPWPLCVDYEWPIAVSWRQVVGPGLVVMLLLAATIWGLRRRSPAAFAGVWAFLILAPTSSVVPVATEVAADHRMYLPLAGLIALTVLALARAWVRIAPSPDAARTIPRGLAALFVAVVVALGAVTIARNRQFASEDRLWAVNVEARPDSPRVRTSYATFLLMAGDNMEAETQFRKALELNPDNVGAMNTLGAALCTQGRIPEGLALIERAASLSPRDPVVFRNLGGLYLRLGRFAESVEAFRQALTRAPDDTAALASVAWVLATAPDAVVRDGTLAVGYAERAAHLTKDQDPFALDALAAGYAESGRFDAAVAASERAIGAAAAMGDADARDIRARLGLYQTGRPFRMSAPRRGEGR